MKKLIKSIAIVIATIMLCYFGAPRQSSFTNITIKNTTATAVKVYLTLQAPNSVVGLFGIRASDTVGSCSKGYFYAFKGRTYQSNTASPLLGAVLSFGADNLPCQAAVPLGFKSGINVFEFSVNTKYEVFDISCEDGVNSILRASVSDTVNWSTGDGEWQQTFRKAQNTFPLVKNLNIRGVFPYRCTDCVALGKAVPQNCFDLPAACSTQRTCQVARTGHNGGNVLIEYLGSVN